MTESETLYAAIGGMPTLRRLSEAFYDRALADVLLAPVFANFTPTHVDHVAVWLGEVFGGPDTFTRRLGGHQALLRSHLGLDITDEHRARWMELMADAVRDVLPEHTDLHAPLMAYFEWGTKIAQEISRMPTDADLGRPGPTPRWDRSGLIE